MRALLDELAAENLANDQLANAALCEFPSGGFLQDETVDLVAVAEIVERVVHLVASGESGELLLGHLVPLARFREFLDAYNLALGQGERHDDLGSSRFL